MLEHGLLKARPDLPEIRKFHLQAASFLRTLCRFHQRLIRHAILIQFRKQRFEPLQKSLGMHTLAIIDQIRGELLHETIQ